MIALTTCIKLIQTLTLFKSNKPEPLPEPLGSLRGSPSSPLSTEHTMDHAVNITICVDNDAFGDTYDDQAHELANILRKLAAKLIRNSDYLDPTKGICPTLKDTNGDRVGSFRLTTKTTTTHSLI
jgi:hypothetical protein